MDVGIWNYPTPVKSRYIFDSWGTQVLRLCWQKTIFRKLNPQFRWSKVPNRNLPEGRKSRPRCSWEVPRSRRHSTCERRRKHGGFLRWGVPQDGQEMDGFSDGKSMKILVKWQMGWFGSTPHFRKPPTCAPWRWQCWAIAIVSTRMVLANKTTIRPTQTFRDNDIRCQRLQQRKKRRWTPGAFIGQL